MVIKDTELERI